MNVMHFSRDDSWRTPIWILDLVREVLGDIDVDPASSFEANENVRATSYLTKEDDGLFTTWFTEPKTVYVNPPWWEDW